MRARALDGAAAGGGDLGRRVARPCVDYRLGRRRALQRREKRRSEAGRNNKDLAKQQKDKAAGQVEEGDRTASKRTSSQPAGVFLKSVWIAWSSRRSMANEVLTEHRPLAEVSSLPMLNTLESHDTGALSPRLGLLRKKRQGVCVCSSLRSQPQGLEKAAAAGGRGGTRR